MSKAPIYQPTYSHGGVDVDGWPAVAGTAQGAGRPVCIFYATRTASMDMVCTGSSGQIVATLEASAGPPDPNTGEPPADSWIDTLNGGLTFAPGDSTGKKLQITHPFWRTRIISRTGDTELVSYVGAIQIQKSGNLFNVSAAYPTVMIDATVGM